MATMSCKHVYSGGACTFCGRTEPWMSITKRRQDSVKAEIARFRAHLLGPKFTGTELTCTSCGLVAHPSTPVRPHGACGGCGSMLTTEERKDWISTGDVLRWLGDLERDLDR